MDAETQGKLAGMAAAEGHAEAVTPGWGDKADSLLREFMKREGAGQTFTCYDARLYAAEKGLADAPDARAWGSVITRAAKNVLISRRGYVNSHQPGCHGTPTTLWEIL